VLLLLPGILSFIRLDWVETIVSYLPLPASSALLTTGAVETQGAYLSAQASLIVMAAYAVVLSPRPPSRCTDATPDALGLDTRTSLSTMTAEILAAIEHLVLRRMINDDAAALASTGTAARAGCC